MILKRWLPKRLRHRRLRLAFSARTDGYHLPTLLFACPEGHAESVLIVEGVMRAVSSKRSSQLPPPLTETTAQTTAKSIELGPPTSYASGDMDEHGHWSATATGGKGSEPSQMAERVRFGAVVLGTAWRGRDRASNAFFGGRDAFLFQLDQEDQRHLCQEQPSEGREEASGSSKGAIPESGARRFRNRDHMDGQLVVTSDFLAIGPAKGGNGFGLLLTSDLASGSSTRSTAFRNTPLHMPGRLPLPSRLPLKTIVGSSDDRATSESDNTRGARSTQRDEFSVLNAELYLLV